MDTGRQGELWFRAGLRAGAEQACTKQPIVAEARRQAHHVTGVFRPTDQSSLEKRNA